MCSCGLQQLLSFLALQVTAREKMARREGGGGEDLEEAEAEEEGASRRGHLVGIEFVLHWPHTSHLTPHWPHTSLTTGEDGEDGEEGGRRGGFGGGGGGFGRKSFGGDGNESGENAGAATHTHITGALPLVLHFDLCLLVCLQERRRESSTFPPLHLRRRTNSLPQWLPG